jgi:hypothetical protein
MVIGSSLRKRVDELKDRASHKSDNNGQQCAKKRHERFGALKQRTPSLHPNYQPTLLSIHLGV